MVIMSKLRKRLFVFSKSKERLLEPDEPSFVQPKICALKLLCGALAMANVAAQLLLLSEKPAPSAAEPLWKRVSASQDASVVARAFSAGGGFTSC